MRQPFLFRWKTKSERETYPTARRRNGKNCFAVQTADRDIFRARGMLENRNLIITRRFLSIHKLSYLESRTRISRVPYSERFLFSKQREYRLGIRYHGRIKSPTTIFVYYPSFGGYFDTWKLELERYNRPSGYIYSEYIGSDNRGSVVFKLMDG